MEHDNIFEELRQHPFVANLEERYLQELVDCASHVTMKEGAMAIREGEVANSFYLIRSGRLSLELDARPRGSVRIQTVGSGDVLGWSWLISPYRWHFSARVVAEMAAICLNGECLRKKCAEDHDFGYVLLERLAKVMEYRLEATRRQLVDVFTTVPEAQP